MAITQEIKEFNEAQSAQIETLEKKFGAAAQEVAKLANKLHAPLYTERAAIVKDIPGFWLQTLVNLGSIAPFLDDADHDALNHLTDINVVEDDSVRGVTITFTFSENPYFSNSTLVKTFKPKADAPEFPDFDLEEHSTHEATKIDWKSDDKNLTKLNPTKGGEDDDDFEPGSFFSTFFETTTPMAASIGETIADELFPNALAIYTGDYEPDVYGDDFEDIDDDDEDDA